jgi:benzylsuccinate CoA-transferase BbsF subunit
MCKSALDGLKVCDFSWVGTGPRATKDLADNGATVIKIESTKRLDLTRLTPPFKDGIFNVDRSGFFAWNNTSKYSVTLNLQHPQGIKVAKRLVQWSDVVVENFGHGFMDRIGLGYEELKRIRQDIIMVSLSIAGQTGPYASFRGYGSSSAALSGHVILTGWPDSSAQMPPIAFGDVITPLFGVISIMAALEYRNRTGKGQYIDISQWETMIQFIAPAFLDYFANGRKETRMGNRCPWAAPHGVFPCKGRDKWCAIAVFSDAQWKSFCHRIGKLDLLDNPKFKTFTDRKENEDELEELVSGWTKQYSREQVMTILQDECIAGIVQDAKDLLGDPQLKERQSFVKLKHPEMGLCNNTAPPMKLSKTPARVRPAPCLGEHNNYVFTKLLGMSDEEFVSLLNAGVFE